MFRNLVLWKACMLLVLVGLTRSAAKDGQKEGKRPHSYISERDKNGTCEKCNPQEKTAEFWRHQAQITLSEKLSSKPITGIAKNVILFLGDGMSIPTLSAARIYLGQKFNKPGEETRLSFEKFPYVGLIKTYCVNSQVPDSACTSTAYLGGVKANQGTIGVTATVQYGDCKAMQNTSNHVPSIARWSQLERKRTGFVTTTKVTDASPSGIYGHTAKRYWQTDSDITESSLDPKDCPDLAHQLIHGETGQSLNVILGGGRGSFIPKNKKDQEGRKGFRGDKRNLIDEWVAQKRNATAKYVWDKNKLLNVSIGTEFVLGLFHNDHMDYSVDRDSTKPSLSEMTEAAIRLLSQGENGYFLFVEEGRIDHAHHSTKARKALEETVEFQKAVQAAVEMTNIEDTLIVVTADHGHTMSISGYGARGEDITGIVGKGSDNLPYTILSYANGPGYRKEKHGSRQNIKTDDIGDYNYQYPSLVPAIKETHGGEDVAIFARGPWAHLLTGVHEQNVIPHIMAYASCVGKGSTACDVIKMNNWRR